MPSVSVAQQHLMQAAEHGANFPAAKKIRKSMTHDQMHDFAVGSESGKPEHSSSAKRKVKPGSKEHRKAYMSKAIKKAHKKYQSDFGGSAPSNPFNSQSY